MNDHLEVHDLSKSFDGFHLQDISFTLPKGYIMGLIGPNGSGKTTTIKLILNMLKRTGGAVSILGFDNIVDEQKAKAELGVVFDTNYFSEDWSVAQVEQSISIFYPNWSKSRFAQMLEKLHISPAKKVKELSKGMQMKLMLACAFSYDAKLLILDEPTSGLDPVSRDELLHLLLYFLSASIPSKNQKRVRLSGANHLITTVWNVACNNVYITQVRITLAVSFVNRISNGFLEPDQK